MSNTHRELHEITCFIRSKNGHKNQTFVRQVNTKLSYNTCQTLCKYHKVVIP